MIIKILENYSKAQKSGAWLPCPRCGKLTMKENLYTNALSRRFDIYICDSCGTDEAMEDIPYFKNALKKFVRLTKEQWFVCKTIYGQIPAVPNDNDSFVVSVKNEIELSKQDIDDIMVCALEGGINYWCDSAEVVEETVVDGKTEKKYLGDFASDQISRGGSLRLYDSESDESYVLTLEKFLTGFALAVQEGYGDDWFENGEFDCMEMDAIGADAIIQFAIFGEKLYA